jgi:hypothetical protein
MRWINIILIQHNHATNTQRNSFFCYTTPMPDEDQKSRIERLKAIYRDFFAEFSSLRKKKDQILEQYETQLEEQQRERLRQKLDKPSV